MLFSMLSSNLKSTSSFLTALAKYEVASIKSKVLPFSLITILSVLVVSNSAVASTFLKLSWIVLITPFRIWVKNLALVASDSSSFKQLSFSSTLLSSKNSEPW